MIFLTSNGLSSPQLQEKFKSCLKKENATCVIIPTAMEKDSQKDVWLKESRDQLESMGLECRVLYPERDTVAQIENYDVVFICGGNVFYLMDKINSWRCRPLFEKLAKEKIIVGESAGSLILQKDLVLIRELIPRMNKRVKLKDFTALDLAGDIEHLPHKSRYTETIDAFEKRVKTYEKKAGHKVVCLEDGQGIFIDGDVIEIIE